MSLKSNREIDGDVKRTRAVSLRTFLTILISVCVLPLVLLAGYLAIYHVHTMEVERDQDCEGLVRNAATAIDQQIRTQIDILKLFASSPLLDDPSRFRELYDQVKGYRESFAGHIILADLSKQMLFNTRSPYGTPLPKLPRPKGRVAADDALETGKPAVGDMFLGPIAGEPLVAVVVPVIREDRIKYLFLSTLETRLFGIYLDKITLPAGYSLTLLDGKGEVIARSTASEQERPAGRFESKSVESSWSVVLEIAETVYSTPITTVIAALMAAILAATLISVFGGRSAAGRIAKSVAKLVEEPPQRSSWPIISEIEAVRGLLEESAAARESAESTCRESEQRFRRLFDMTPVPLLFVDKDGEILNFNSRFQQTFGYCREELQSLEEWWTSAYPDADYRRRVIDSWGAGLIRARQTQSDIESAEYHVTCKSGEILTMVISGITLGGGFLSAFFDITDRKRAEKALQDRERLLDKIYEILPVGLWISDKNGRLIRTNAMVRKIWGAAPLVGPEQYGVFKARRLPSGEEISPGDWAISRTLNAGITIKDELLEIEAFDGVKRIILNYTAPVADEQGNIDAVVIVNLDITHRVHAEEGLRESEAKYRLLFDEAPVGILYVDTEGRILEANRKLVEIMGSPSAEKTKSINMLTFPLLVEAGISGVFKKCLDTAQPQSAELPYISKWGKTIYLRMLVRPTLSATGAVTGCQAVLEDVSEKKSAEARLERELAINSALAELYLPLMSQAASIKEIAEAVLDKARKLTGSLHGYVSEIDPQSGDNVSHTLIKMMDEGCEVGGGMKIAFPRGSDGSYSRLFGYSMNTGEAFFSNTPSLHPAWVGLPPGHIPLERFLSVPVTLEGQIVGQIALANAPEDYGEEDLDVIRRLAEYYALALQRKRWEAALKEGRDTLQLVLSGADLGFWDFDVKKGMFIVNERTLSMLGYQHGETETTFEMWKSGIHPDDRQRVSETLNSHFKAQSEQYEDEYRLQTKGGEWVWVLARGRVVERDENGLPLRMTGTLLDTSQRKRSELAQRRLATAVEQAVEGIVITDVDGNVVYVNPAYERLTGYSLKELMGTKPLLLRVDEDDSVTSHAILATISRGERWSGHVVKKNKDGLPYEEDVTVTPVLDPQGSSVNFVIVKRDVTREAGLQKQLLQAQKMEAIGTLAGGIAHDFNNLLQVTLGYSELLLSEKSQDDPDYPDLQKIHKAASSGADLVRSLLTFSRKLEAKPAPLNLNQQVKHVERLLNRTIPKMIDIRLHLAKDLWRINADATQIEQVIMNMAVNARDAMSEGGVLTIKTENVTFDEEFCRRYVEATPGDFVLLSVSDTGQGMEKETLQHIFEPFYTTKELGRGTGLGLAMVYGIVKRHGGYLNCYSEIGKGTSFNVYLPAIPNDPGTESRISVQIPEGGNETVLLVDDEDTVREVGERILTKFGYTVCTAGDGAEAIRVYLNRSCNIDLIILDLIMPTMGGKECLKELLTINPTARVLIASGYSADSSMTECIDLGAKGFVGKPYDKLRLLTMVRNVLDSQ